MLLRLLGQFCLLLAATATALPPAAAQAPAASARGFAWEAVRGNDRVLLIGTLHVGRATVAALSPALTAALAGAQAIAFEANVFDAQASLAAAQRHAMYPAGAPGLDASADAATIARIDRIAARSAAGLSLCCRMKPWMVANTLVILEAAGAGFSPAFGSEAQLYQFALARGRPIVEIESVDEQLRLFDGVTAAVQLDYLRHTLETIESGAARAEIERLVGAWERGDAEAMERLAVDLSRGEGAAQRYFAERIYRGRHPKMAAAIERFAGSGRLHAVAIGALHYFGPDGLLAMLRERGYTLERLR